MHYQKNLQIERSYKPYQPEYWTEAFEESYISLTELEKKSGIIGVKMMNKIEELSSLTFQNWKKVMDLINIGTGSKFFLEVGLGKPVGIRIIQEADFFHVFE